MPGPWPNEFIWMKANPRLPRPDILLLCRSAMSVMRIHSISKQRVTRLVVFFRSRDSMRSSRMGDMMMTIIALGYMKIS